MTSSHSDSTFPKPNPEELKSEESKAKVRKQLVNKPEGEALLDDQESNPRDPAILLDHEDSLADRHPPQLNSPPG